MSESGPRATIRPCVGWVSRKRTPAVFRLFAFCHAEQGPAGIIAAGWFGLLAAVYYLKLGMLWPAVIAHLAVDLLLLGPW